MATFEEKSKLKALILTLTFHGVVLFIFLLFVFKNPDPPMFADSAGVEVNLGFSDEGMGDIQPLEPTTPSSTQKVSQTVPKSTPKEQILTQETEDVPVTEKKLEEKPKEIKEPIKEPVKEEIKQPVVNQKALYTGKKNTSNATGSEGETGKPGDQGIKEGSVYSKVHGNVNGSGNSGSEGRGSAEGGISYSLSGRKMLKQPEVVDRSQETGKVVVSITVDKNGNVIKATPGARGSTTTSANLYSKAQQAAMKAKFDANTSAAEEQYGSITFIFIVQ
jgi:periplasmic protein TonB